MKYGPDRRYKRGDLVRITGYRGRLFGCGNKREINDKYKLGVEVVLEEGEDYSGDVVIPEGILKGNKILLSCACIELVEPVEEIRKNILIMSLMKEYVFKYGKISPLFMKYIGKQVFIQDRLTVRKKH